VLIEFVRTHANGEEYVYHTIKLTNAIIIGIKQYTKLDNSSLRIDTHEVEEITLTFQKIEIENKNGKTSATDDWQK
jgi:type VI secretion system Hcp family effector